MTNPRLLKFEKNDFYHKTTHRFHWKDIKNKEHFVQFYNDDAFLINSLINYVGKGIGKGAVGIVIATESHRLLLEKKLKTIGINVSELKQAGTFFSLDAEEMLNNFMVNDMPDSNLFRKNMEEVWSQIDHSRYSIRAYGEMVALLWEQKKYQAAIRLEQLWNDLGDKYAFSLFCGYQIHSINNDENYSMKDICLTHTKSLIHSK